MGSHPKDSSKPSQPPAGITSDRPLSLAPEGLTEDIDDAWGEEDGAPSEAKGSTAAAPSRSTAGAGRPLPAVGLPSGLPAKVASSSRPSQEGGTGPGLISRISARPGLGSGGQVQSPSVPATRSPTQSTATPGALAFARAVVAASSSSADTTGPATGSPAGRLSSRPPGAKNQLGPTTIGLAPKNARAATSGATAAETAAAASQSESRPAGAPGPTRREGSVRPPVAAVEYPRRTLALSEKPQAEVAVVRTVGIGASGAPETVIEREAIKGPEPSTASPSGDAERAAAGATAGGCESPVSVAEGAAGSAPAGVETPPAGGVVCAEESASDTTDTVQGGSEEQATEGDAGSSISVARSSARRETEPEAPGVGETQGASAAAPPADALPRAPAAAGAAEKSGWSLWIWLAVAAVTAAGVYWFATRHSGRRRVDAESGEVVTATAAGFEARPRQPEAPPEQPDTQTAPATSGAVTAAPLAEGPVNAAVGSVVASEGAPPSDAAESDVSEEDAPEAGLVASGESSDSTKGAVGETVDAAAAPGEVRVQLYVEPLDTRVARRGARVKAPYIFDIRKGERIVLELVRSGYTTRRVVLDGKQKVVRVGMRSYQPRPSAPAAAPTPVAAPTPAATPTPVDPVPAQ